MQPPRNRIKAYDIRTPSAQAKASTLSGGNQQKVVIAREFSRDLRLLVLDQPTRGLDVGSIEFIHKQTIAKRDAGAAILLVSAELDEILELSDRIAVIYRGKLVGLRDGRTADKNDVGLLMATGGRADGGDGTADWRAAGARHERPPRAARGASSRCRSISVVLSVIVGSLVIIFSQWLVTGELSPGLALDAYGALISGSVGSANGHRQHAQQHDAALLGGLAVGLGFKAGLFNIGVQGQFLMGALGSVIVGVQLRESPAAHRGPVSLVAGMIFGAAWGFIPGFLKAVSGAHEVVTTIMLNFVAIAILAAAVSGPLNVVGSASPTTLPVGNASLPVILGRNGTIAIIYAPHHGRPVRLASVPHDARVRDPNRRREP